MSSALMAQQEEDGWPLGLRVVNGRLGLLEDRDFCRSFSFNTLPTPTFTHSSDLDSQSSGSFFQAQSITVDDSITVEVPRRWSRKNYLKSRSWLFSLCCKLSTNAVSVTRTHSLAHFLEAERRRAAAFDQTS